MTDIERGDVDAHIDALLKLSVMVDKDGELLPEELEELDKEMLKVGSSRTGQRTGVRSTDTKKKAYVDYVYQETLSDWSINNVVERIEAFTRFDDIRVWVDVEIVEYNTVHTGVKRTAEEMINDAIQAQDNINTIVYFDDYISEDEAGDSEFGERLFDRIQERVNETFDDKGVRFHQAGGRDRLNIESRGAQYTGISIMEEK